MTDALTIWTIYDHPRDFPDNYVARRFENDVPTTEVIIAPDLDKLRRFFIHNGLVCIARSEEDQPQIVESWL